MNGFLSQHGYTVQQHRVRESMRRVGPGGGGIVAGIRNESYKSSTLSRCWTSMFMAHSWKSQIDSVSTESTVLNQEIIVRCFKM